MLRALLLPQTLASCAHPLTRWTSFLPNAQGLYSPPFPVPQPLSRSRKICTPLFFFFFFFFTLLHSGGRKTPKSVGRCWPPPDTPRRGTQSGPTAAAIAFTGYAVQMRRQHLRQQHLRQQHLQYVRALVIRGNVLYYCCCGVVFFVFFLWRGRGEGCIILYIYFTYLLF